MGWRMSFCDRPPEGRRMSLQNLLLELFREAPKSLDPWRWMWDERLLVSERRQLLEGIGASLSVLHKEWLYLGLDLQCQLEEAMIREVGESWE
jgi:hypothetical protein